MVMLPWRDVRLGPQSFDISDLSTIVVAGVSQDVYVFFVKNSLGSFHSYTQVIKVIDTSAKLINDDTVFTIYRCLNIVPYLNDIAVFYDGFGVWISKRNLPVLALLDLLTDIVEVLFPACPPLAGFTRLSIF